MPPTASVASKRRDSRFIAICPASTWRKARLRATVMAKSSGFHSGILAQ